MIELLLIGGLVFVLYEAGTFAPFGYVPSTTGTALPVSRQAIQEQGSTVIRQTEYSVTQPGQESSVNAVGLGVQAGAAVGTGAFAGAGSTATFAGLSGAALGAVTAGIGVAVTIFAVLWSRHQQRVAQAKRENSEVNVAVPGFDSDLQLINQQYNAGQIDAVTAVRAIQQAYAQYWLLVTPYIQPGRNGCQGGQNCANAVAIAKTGRQPCVGDIGAACCIGCVPMYYSLYDDGTWVGASPKGPGAITVLQSGGGTSVVKTIGGSSYGARTRMGYTLNWSRQ